MEIERNIENDLRHIGMTTIRSFADGHYQFLVPVNDTLREIGIRKSIHRSGFVLTIESGELFVTSATIRFGGPEKDYEHDGTVQEKFSDLVRRNAPAEVARGMETTEKEFLHVLFGTDRLETQQEARVPYKKFLKWLESTYQEFLYLNQEVN